MRDAPSFSAESRRHKDSQRRGDVRSVESQPDSSGGNTPEIAPNALHPMAWGQPRSGATPGNAEGEPRTPKGFHKTEGHPPLSNPAGVVFCDCSILGWRGCAADPRLLDVTPLAYLLFFLRGPLRLWVFALSVTLALPLISLAEPPVTDSDREHWAFTSLQRPEVPRTDFVKLPPEFAFDRHELADWSRNPIDEFILARLIENGLAPMPSADRTTLIRRLSFDLTGLPPTPEEIDAFVHDPRPDAFEQLVERLLASSAYGERWAQHWLDLARFAETDGFEHDKLRPDSWKYRDWVIDALNEDLPYDEFVLAQLAGDEPPNNNRIATGFLTCGPDMPDINLQDERRHSFMNDMTSTVGSVFLGLQIGCAQCHDHKFDPVSQLDFYRMRAFFDRAFEFTKNQTVALPQRNGKSFKSHLMIRGDFRRKGEPVEPAFLRIANSKDRSPEIAEGKPGRRTQLAQWITRPDNPLSTRVLANRLWYYHFGEGLSETPSDFGLVGDSPIHLELLDWLATEIPRRGWSLKEMHRLIVTSSTWRQPSRPDLSQNNLVVRWENSLEKDKLNRLYSRGRRRRLEGEAIRDAILAASGQLNQRREGPGIRPPLPQELVRSLLRDQWPVSSEAADFSRRSIYIFVRRNLRYPIFEAFDKPDTNASCSRRNTSTIAPQALMLMNSDVSVDAAKAFAGRILAHENGHSRGKQIELGFRLTLGRFPKSSDAATALTFLEDDTAYHEAARKAGQKLNIPPGDLPVPEAEAAALVDLCLGLFNLSEFIYVD